MAEPRKDDNLFDSFIEDEARHAKQEHVRSSDDREDQERSDTDLPRDRDHHETVAQENVEDIDPDRAESDVDRDDSSVE